MLGLLLLLLLLLLEAVCALEHVEEPLCLVVEVVQRAGLFFESAPLAQLPVQSSGCADGEVVLGPLAIGV